MSALCTILPSDATAPGNMWWSHDMSHDGHVTHLLLGSLRRWRCFGWSSAEWRPCAREGDPLLYHLSTYISLVLETERIEPAQNTCNGRQPRSQAFLRPGTEAKLHVSLNWWYWSKNIMITWLTTWWEILNQYIISILSVHLLHTWAVLPAVLYGEITSNK